MAMTDAEYAAIRAAYYSGATTVSYMGRTIAYDRASVERIFKEEQSRRSSGGRRTFVRAKFRSDSGSCR